MTEPVSHVVTPEPVTRANSSFKLKFGIVCSVCANRVEAGEQVALSSEEPLTVAIETVCEAWGLKDPKMFALQFTEADQGKYITEKMRDSLLGKVVNLVYSPEYLLEGIEGRFKRLNALTTIEHGLKDLVEKTRDPVLVDAFVARARNDQGLKLLTTIISSDVLGHKEMALANAYQALTDIAMHSTMPCWDLIPPSVYQKIINYVNNTQKPVAERCALGKAYTFLEYAISEGQALQKIIQDLSFTTIIANLNHPDPTVIFSALALLNAMLEKAKGSYEYILSEVCYREKIFDVTRVGSRLNEGIRRQLYKLQCYRLRIINARQKTCVSPEDEDAMEKITEIISIALGSAWAYGLDANARKSVKPDKTKAFKKLGFQNVQHPFLDFSQVPPGVLALDCMYYLAKEKPERFKTILLESSALAEGEECPFATSSIQLVLVLCDVLHVGEPVLGTEGKYWPFIFQCSKPFEELFCICAQLVTKTWREMRATATDFDTVFDVVREQIHCSLEHLPEDSMDSKDFWKLVNDYSYSRIKIMREAQINVDKEQIINQLKEDLIPSMTELVKKNRLNYLMKGTYFSGNSKILIAKTKEKMWCCRLAPSGKTLHCVDYNQENEFSLEERKVPVNEIESLLIGEDCPHFNKEMRKTGYFWTFSIVYSNAPFKSINFFTSDESEFNFWTDGINALMGKPMESLAAKADLEDLVDMEIKVRLPDIEMIPDIPEQPPQIPAPPQDFDFSTFLK